MEKQTGALLNIKNLTVRFATSTGAFTAVDGVDVSVSPELFK